MIEHPKTFLFETFYLEIIFSKLINKFQQAINRNSAAIVINLYVMYQESIYEILSKCKQY